MPRIVTGSNDPVDFCRVCFPKTEEAARAEYGNGEGPDGRGNCFAYDAEHPPYNRANGYQCSSWACNKPLIGEDN